MIGSRKALVAMALLVAAFGAGAAAAQERTGHKDGFTALPAGARILLLRPQIKVGEQSMAGMPEPNADWTDQARGHIGTALGTMQAGLGHVIVTPDEPIGDDAARLAEYRGLFQTMALSVQTYQFFPGNRLPTKKRAKSVLDWSMGEEIRDLPGATGADYVLFLCTEDQYGSTGRKMAQLFLAMAGVGITSGVHQGYAGLVDLKTGDLVWLNADPQMGGDVRTPEGAQRRVDQLLKGFPGRNPAPTTVASAR